VSRDLADLDPVFLADVLRLYEACLRRGVTMRPFSTLRDPWEQARIWRSSRSSRQVRQAVETLRAAGAAFLADVLESVGPQAARGRGHLTNALPGNSWHQWALAIDNYWLADVDGDGDGDAVWSAETKIGGVNGYQVYREEAMRLGLHRAGRSDWPHTQGPKDSSPRTSGLTWAQIDAEMQARFGP